MFSMIEGKRLSVQEEVLKVVFAVVQVSLAPSPSYASHESKSSSSYFHMASWMQFRLQLFGNLLGW